MVSISLWELFKSPDTQTLFRERQYCSSGGLGEHVGEGSHSRGGCWLTSGHSLNWPLLLGIQNWVVIGKEFFYLELMCAVPRSRFFICKSCGWPRLQCYLRKLLQGAQGPWHHRHIITKLTAIAYAVCICNDVWEAESLERLFSVSCCWSLSSALKRV